MSNLVASFISELIRAANETERLTPQERARLLQRAGVTVRDYLDQIGTHAPRYDDILRDLNSMVATIDIHDGHEVQAMMLRAVAAIKGARADLDLSLDAEYEKMIDEMNNPDRCG